tara:strand:- start:232 stop:1344 length:1113 start_codon:yes stop_codon:yes gene_type:complete
MKKKILSYLLASGFLFFASCGTDTPDPVACETTAPNSYEFTHEGNNTVGYDGQTKRLLMVDEIMTLLGLETTTDVSLLNQMYADGTGFTGEGLDASGKQVRSKTAGYQSATVKAAIQSLFDAWLLDYAENVAPALANMTDAAPGVAGWVGSRELNSKGMELDQLFAKGLIGALCLDQTINGYLSNAKLSIADNESRDSEDYYTTMEHYWDEGFGYIYGKDTDLSNDEILNDNLLGKYLTKYADHRLTVFNAFKAGRQAIVDGCMDERDNQAKIIQETLSKVVAIRAEFYLRDAADKVDLSADYFHSLSEGYGFIMSLQFTMDENGNPYFTHEEVNSMLDQLGSGDGFWDRTDSELVQMADDINAVTGVTL